MKNMNWIGSAVSVVGLVVSLGVSLSAQAQVICMDPLNADFHLKIDVLGNSSVLLQISNEDWSGAKAETIEASLNPSASQSGKIEYVNAQSKLSVTLDETILSGTSRQGYAVVSGGPDGFPDTYHCMRSTSESMLMPLVKCKDIKIEGMDLSRAEVYTSTTATSHGVTTQARVLTFDRKNKLAENFSLDGMYVNSKSFRLTSQGGADTILSQDYSNHWVITLQSDPDLAPTVIPVSCQ
jgi:hypothetical protein